MATYAVEEQEVLHNLNVFVALVIHRSNQMRCDVLSTELFGRTVCVPTILQTEQLLENLLNLKSIFSLSTNFV